MRFDLRETRIGSVVVEGEIKGTTGGEERKEGEKGKLH